MGSTHIVEQLLLFKVPSILTFDFDLNLGSLVSFLGPNGLFLRLGSKGVLGSTHVVEQLLFSIVPSILTFDFDQILGLIFGFWGPNGLFWGLGSLKNMFLGSTHHD